MHIKNREDRSEASLLMRVLNTKGVGKMGDSDSAATCWPY